MRSSWHAYPAAALALLLCGHAHFAQAQEQPKRVLIVNPDTIEHPAANTITRAASGRLSQALPGKIEIFAEFLDASRFPGQVDRQQFADFLAAKYSTKQIDAVLTIGPVALQFVADHGRRIGRDAPVVFCCISPASRARIGLPQDATGLVSEYSLTRTMDLAALLQPKAKSVVVVIGASDFDRQWEANARRQLAPYASRYEFTYLVGLPFDQLLGRLGSLPRDTIVLFTTMFADGAGKTFPRPPDLVPEISAASNAPVYAPYDSYLDRGIVGGHMNTFEGTGIALGELTLNVLAGERPPVRSDTPGSYRVDWRQLRRWGLSEASLPADAIVLFKEPSLWEEHRSLIIAAIGAFALQSAVVAFLLVERRRRFGAEHSLLESEKRMGIAAASVNVGLWHYDAEARQLWATDYCRTMFNIPLDVPLAPDSFARAVYTDDISVAQRWLRDVTRSEKPQIAEFRIRLATGEVRWYLARGLTHFDDLGNPVRTSGAFSDITARKIAEEEAEAQRRTLAHIARVSTLGELSGAIAHEINQPLTAILANAEAASRMLVQEQPRLNEIGEALNDIIAEDNRAGDVIRRLRGMLRRGERKVEVYSPNELVSSVLRLLRSELVSRQVSVDLDLAPDLPDMVGDQVQIQQVLTNLLVNAIDAVSAPGARDRTITVTTASPRPGFVETAVTDHGPGIATDQQARLLEPFYTTKENGLGLGLSICNSIVNAHGGVLSIVNGLDRGARASFTLPVARAGTTA